MNTMKIDRQLQKLVNMIDPSLDVVEDNVLPCTTVWKLWNGVGQVGQLEARFGSIYADEPDGFAAYIEGRGWTKFHLTVEECAAELLD